MSFEVEDTGPGIAPDELDSLFAAFIQTKIGQISHEGTGLGLLISQKFVQLMGGEITVSSEVGHGTTFRFDITVSMIEASDIETRRSTRRRIIALEPDQPRYRILIVDDKPDNRKLLVKLLNPFVPSTNAFSPDLVEGLRQGLELREAQNGREAIKIWEDWEPHLIWMDMRMPMMDGYEATKHIKATLKGRATVVIAVTASSFEEEQAVALSVGCDDFLRKPFQEAEIFDLLHRHLGVRFVYEEEKQSTIDNRQVKRC